MVVLKKSIYTLILVLGSLLAGLVVFLGGYFGGANLALSLSVISLGLLVALAYWNLRRTMTIINRGFRTGFGELENKNRTLISGLNRAVSTIQDGSSRIVSLQKSLNTLEGFLVSPESNTAKVGFTSEKLNVMNDQLALLKDQINGQQALLQEIVVSLDLRDRADRGHDRRSR